jgi:hypothetical protein
MSLTNWRDNGWVVEHQTSQEEISDLLNVADRDLSDCESPGLSPDWQLSIAYNAALQSATAALAACGYRSSREAHHYRVIQSLAHTIEAESNVINQFDKFRKKRNIGGYEAAGRISQQEADEMKKLAKELYEQIVKWLHQNRADLIAKER